VPETVSDWPVSIEPGKSYRSAADVGGSLWLIPLVTPGAGVDVLKQDRGVRLDSA
jgi:hypothetical protein